jgi:FkbM family methyltransferase
MTPDSLRFRALELYGTRMNHRGQWFVHEKLRELLRVKVDVDLNVTRDGLKWVLNPSDHQQSGLFWLGAQDYWDIYHIKKLLKPGDVIFDVGANFGYYSIVLSSSLQKECSVHAFEPNPPTAERLQKNIDLNNLNDVITIHRVGLSDTGGKGRMIERPDNSGAATIDTSEDEGNAVLTTLDSFCDTNLIDRIDFIKIDIEGFEERMLLGGRESLKRLKPVILIELNPPTLARENSSVERIAELLGEMGYRLYASERRKLVPMTQLPQGDEIVNASCFHQDRQENLCG